MVDKFYIYIITCLGLICTATYLSKNCTFSQCILISNDNYGEWRIYRKRLTMHTKAKNGSGKEEKSKHSCDMSYFIICPIFVCIRYKQTCKRVWSKICKFSLCGTVSHKCSNSPQVSLVFVSGYCIYYFKHEQWFCISNNFLLVW